MRTRLYKDVENNNILVLSDVKDIYAEVNNSDLPIPDAEMELIILTEMVTSKGGNLAVINDEILEWCNDYSEYQEADRYLNQEEKALSVRNVYTNICCRDEFCSELTKYLTDDEEGKKLLSRLEKLLNK